MKKSLIIILPAILLFLSFSCRTSRVTTKQNVQNGNVQNEMIIDSLTSLKQYIERNIEDLELRIAILKEAENTEKNSYFNTDIDNLEENLNRLRADEKEVDRQLGRLK